MQSRDSNVKGDNMTRPKGTGGIAKSLTPEEIRRLYRTIEEYPHARRNRALVDLALGTGMRISEVVSLYVRDVYNTDTCEVLNEIALEKHSTKACVSRTVAVAPFARYSVQQYVEQYVKAHLQLPNQIVGVDDVHTCALFPVNWDSIRHQVRMLPNAAASLVRRLLRAANIPNASSHSFRRTHADMLRRMGVDLHIIQKQLGHSSLATTERYFAIDPAEIRRAVDRLEI